MSNPPKGRIEFDDPTFRPVPPEGQSFGAALMQLITIAAPFARVANIIDALPGEHRRADDSPLRDSMPGAWPTVGDVRRLRDELVRMGWKP